MVSNFTVNIKIPWAPLWDYLRLPMLRGVDPPLGGWLLSITGVKSGEFYQRLRATNLNKLSGKRSGAVQYLLADFSDLQQVRDLAANFKEQYSRLDVLVNNAGGFFNSKQETPYGIEKTFLVNHLSPFLLTNLLLGTLQGSSSARIVNVSSDAHKLDKMNFEDLGFQRGYFGMKAYARSKLANIFFTYELARRLGVSNVTVNALHPGHVATDIWKTNFAFIGPVIKKVMGLFALTPEEGADNAVYLASSPELDGVTGKYFIKHASVRSSDISYDKGIAQKLWEISEDFTALNFSTNNTK